MANLLGGTNILSLLGMSGKHAQIASLAVVVPRTSGWTACSGDLDLDIDDNSVSLLYLPSDNNRVAVINQDSVLFKASNINHLSRGAIHLTLI